MSNVAVISWFDEPDDVAKMIHNRLHNLGYTPQFFRHYEPIPQNAEIVFTYAPWGRLQIVTKQLSQMPASRRPRWVHWMTEDPPDLRIPWPLLHPVCNARAWLDRLHDADQPLLRKLVSLPGVRLVASRMHKFRYLGTYSYALKNGYLTVLADISKVYADFLNSGGITTIYAPWGLLDDSYADLNLERDIDVLWLGTRRTKRRSQLLDRVTAHLRGANVHVHIVDGIENPPIFGDDRTRLLNRSKISLNLLPTWYDNTLIYRLPLAAANKSMVVSERSLDHCPSYQHEQHYVGVEAERLSDTILHYLAHLDKRQKIVDQAYDTVIGSQQLTHSVKLIMDTLESK